MINPVITIDGASGAGKGTLTSRLAQRLGFAMLDSGALYRVVGLMAARQGLLSLDAADGDTTLEQPLAALTQGLKLQFKPQPATPQTTATSPEQSQPAAIGIWVNGEDVSDAIRSEQVGAYASRVAVYPAVRQALLELQRNMADGQGLVADGRDMGTVVFPNAQLKIYLIATPTARAKRRHTQLQQAGKPSEFEQILAQIIDRDERDTSRAVAPAMPAADAIIIDTSELDADEVFAQVWGLCVERGLTALR